MQPHDSGFFLALLRILVTSPRYGAPQRGPGLSGNLDSSAFAQFVGAADALARGVRPPGKRAPLDGNFHPGYAVSSRQGQVAAQSRAAGSLRLLRLRLAVLLEPELAASPSGVVAFEPDGENFTQYFFLGRDDFAAAGLRSEVAAAILTRLEELQGACSDCGKPATWLWISRREVSNLDQTERIAASRPERFFARSTEPRNCARR